MTVVIWEQNVMILLIFQDLLTYNISHDFCDFLYIDFFSDSIIAWKFNVGASTKRRSRSLFRCTKYRCSTDLLTDVLFIREWKYHSQVDSLSTSISGIISFLRLFSPPSLFIPLLFFLFVFARLPRLYDPPERSMFPLRDTRVTPFSRTALDHKGR